MEAISFLLAIVIVILSRVPVLNFIGSILRYGNCPSCGNSWFWNGSGSIEYETLEKGKSIMISGGTSRVFSVQACKSVMICERCLGRPDNIDSGRIENDLIKHGWESGDVDRVVHAVERFKRESKS